MSDIKVAFDTLLDIQLTAEEDRGGKEKNKEIILQRLADKTMTRYLDVSND